MTHSAVYMPNAEMLCQHVMLSSQMQTNLSYIDDYRNEIYMKTRMKNMLKDIFISFKINCVNLFDKILYWNELEQTRNEILGIVL